MNTDSINPNEYELWGLRRGNSAYLLMVEALRRYTRFTDEAAKGLERACVGLGTLSAYRPAYDKGLMTPRGGWLPPSRCQSWWILTEKGRTIILHWLEAGWDYRQIEAGQLPPRF